MIRATEIHHAQIGDDAAQVDAAVIAPRDPAGGIISGARHTIDLIRDEHARTVRGNEHRICMIDAIPRKTPCAKHLRPGLRVRAAQCRQIRLAEPIDLGRRHHRMATPGPHRAVKEARERQMARRLAIVIAARPQRNRLFDQPGLAIGHHQPRRMGQLGEPDAQTRDRPDPGPDHLAVVAERLGHRRDTKFSQCRHRQNIGRGSAPTASIPPTEAR